METIKLCMTCKAFTETGNAGKCENCQEVESRLEEYLKSKKGFNFVHCALCKIRYVPAETNK